MTRRPRGSERHDEEGLLSGAAAAVEGTVHAVTHPVQTAEGIVWTVKNPKAAAQALLDSCDGHSIQWCIGYAGTSLAGAKGTTAVLKAMRASGSSNGSPEGSAPEGGGKPESESGPKSGGGNTTRQGVPRTNPRDWRRLRDTWDQAGMGGILSAENRGKIAKGITPTVDDAWVKWFPGDFTLMGERIPMHHIGGFPLDVPLPDSRHLDAHMPGGFRDNPGGPGMTG